MKESNAIKPDVTENDEKEILSGVRRLRILGIFNIRIFMLVLFAFFIVSLIIPLRPSYSESEKRELAKFPSFSFSALFSGDYFDGINEWYADTFPFREALTGLNARVSALFGKTDVQIHGTVEQGDEIPDLPPESEDSSSSEQTEHQGTESGESSENQSSESSSPSSSEESQSQPGSGDTAADNSTQTLGALLINGDTAYEYYNFVRSTADSYIAAINNAGKLLEGKATVYDIIVPNSMGICAPESITSGINTSDQKKAINYMYSGMNSVKTVPVFDTLKAHRNEYIYFRTDHHWTALGAYYAYCELMKAKGVSPSPLDSFTVREFPGYLGSFYTSSGKLPQFAANPDTVYAYQPKETNSIDVLYENGVWKYGQEIISDMTTASQGSKYLTFIKGDRPLSIIKNPALTDGSACVVIKESYGNAFVPFLVSHYQNVYIIDYRYFSKVDKRGLVQFCTDTGAKDVIFINNVSATRSKSLVASIAGLVR